MKNPALRQVLVAVATLLLTTSRAAAQVVSGTVVVSGMVLNGTSRQPVGGVRVVALGTTDNMLGHDISAPDGQFTVHLPAAGTYRLQASRLGYAKWITEPITLDSTGQANVIIQLVPDPVSLDPVSVVAKKTTYPQLLFLVQAGFYDRQRRGFGYFLTHQDFETYDPMMMSDILRNLPGVRVRCTSPLICSVTMPAATTMFVGRKCQPSVVLDGILLSAGGTGGAGSVNELLNPFNIEALEVYPSAAGVPVQWGGYLSPCGAIIAWSRR